ncbi:Uncharacterised protein [Mycobacteroides abscessus subsp. abscessus]|nr:Uncharacterised protein [Mycobacteroides abscessus subsp. abscessus]
MGLTLGDALAVELRHLLDQIVIVQDDGTARSDGERMLIASGRRSGVSCCVEIVLIRHIASKGLGSAKSCQRGVGLFQRRALDTRRRTDLPQKLRLPSPKGLNQQGRYSRG